MFALGYDIGSSSVKASLIEIESGKTAASAFSPHEEMPIHAPRQGWAEQHPEEWWCQLRNATAMILQASRVQAEDIASIGISYQMHGLVCLDAAGEVVRPAIIWCDSRAVEIGRKAFSELGEEECLGRSLNSPGNFTASKLAWVRQNEPHLYEKIDTFMLPGDYIAYRLTGEACTTIGGLSEGMLWDFKENRPAQYLLDHYGISPNLLPRICPTFGEQGRLTPQAANELGLRSGTPVCYRAGDQPNNAFSLHVLNAGEIASTAGTSGVVYGVSDTIRSDRKGRIGTFAHVNHSSSDPHLGLLLCINGTGCLNAFMKKTVAPDGMSYPEMNLLAMQSPIGSAGLSILPFGNGSERMLCDQDLGCSIHGLRFNLHRREHLLRAAQEGIAFSFRQGIDLMRSMGMPIRRIHAGAANMYLSPIFCEAVANLTGADIVLYDTDGSIGAARGGACGASLYQNTEEAFATLQKKHVIHPDPNKQKAYAEAYDRWTEVLTHTLRF